MVKKNEEKNTELKNELEIEVKDPEIFKPKELPLVVTPKGGKWENEEQANFAKTLNGYAYKNPKKWDIKKEVLLKQLVEIGKNKSLYYKVSGNNAENDNLSFKNKLLE